MESCLLHRALSCGAAYFISYQMQITVFFSELNLKAGFNMVQTEDCFDLWLCVTSPLLLFLLSPMIAPRF
jgi:hypothetical protein